MPPTCCCTLLFAYSMRRVVSTARIHTLRNFERDLASNGYFEDFKQEFSNRWLANHGAKAVVRPCYGMMICEAYAAVTGKPEQDSIIQRYEDTYTMTVGDFADDVNVWLFRQEPNRRILFLVDEVAPVHR